VRRILAAVLVAILVAWLALPVARSYLLVAAHHSDPLPPADLAVTDLDLGADLSGWSVQVAIGAPAVVLVHGFKTSREEMLPWARFLHNAGYNVVLFDTRGCGRSAGAVIGLGATEPRDISRAVAAARGVFRTTAVAALGISVGAGAVILAAATDPGVTAVVADSAWTDEDFQLGRLSFIPVGPVRVPLPPYGVAVVNALVGADVSQARPLEVIGRIAPRPVLLIHSADDENATTTVDGARRLFEAAAEPKQIWIVPHGGHVGAINAFPNEYRARVLAFLATALR